MADDLRQKIVIVTNDKELKTLLADLGKVSETGKKAAASVTKTGKATTAAMTKGSKAAAGLTKGLKGVLGSLTGIASLGVAAVFAGIALALKKVVGQAAAFEKAFAEVRTLIDETKISSGLLRIQLLSLAKVRPIGLLDLTAALYQLISAGIDAEKSVKVLDIATKAAVAGLTTAEVAIDGITSVLKAWSLGAEEAQRVSDAFFVSVRNGKTTFVELANVIGQLAPIASAVGVSIEEAFSAVTALTQAGVRTNLAATQVRSLLVAIARQVPQTVKVANELGVSFDTVALRAKGLQKFLNDVKEAAAGNDTSLTRLVGRIEALQAIMALTGAASAAFAKNLEDMAHKAGVTDLAFSKMERTSLNLFEILKGKLEVVIINIGSSVLPLLSAGLSDLIDLFDDARPAAQRMLDAVQDLEGLNPRIVAQLELMVRKEQIDETITSLRERIDSVELSIPISFKETEETFFQGLKRILTSGSLLVLLKGELPIVDFFENLFADVGPIVVPDEILDLSGLTDNEKVKKAQQAINELTREVQALSVVFLEGAEGTERFKAGQVALSELLIDAKKQVGELTKERKDAKGNVIALTKAEQKQLDFLNEQIRMYRLGLLVGAERNKMSAEDKRLINDRVAGLWDSVKALEVQNDAIKLNTKLMQDSADAAAEMILAQSMFEDSEVETIKSIMEEIKKREKEFRDVWERAPILQREQKQAEYAEGLLKFQDALKRDARFTANIGKALAESIEGTIQTARLWGESVAEATAKLKEMQTVIDGAGDAAERLEDKLTLKDIPDAFKKTMREILQTKRTIEDIDETIAAFEFKKVSTGLEVDEEDMLQLQKQLREAFEKVAGDLQLEFDAQEGLDAALDKFFMDVRANADQLERFIIEFALQIEEDPSILKDKLEERVAELQGEIGAIEIRIAAAPKGAEGSALRKQLDGDIDALNEKIQATVDGIYEIFLRAVPGAKQAMAAIRKIMEDAKLDDIVSDQIDNIVDKFITVSRQASIDLEITGKIDEGEFATIIQRATDEAAAAFKTLIDSGVLTEEQVAEITSELLSMALAAKDAAMQLGKLGDILDFASQVLGDFAAIAGAIGGISNATVQLIADTGRLIGVIKNAAAAYKRLAAERALSASTDPTDTSASVAAELGAAAATISVVAGVTVAIAGFVSSIAQSAKQRREEHLKEVRRMLELENELRRNTEQLKKGLQEIFAGGTIGGGLTTAQLNEALEALPAMRDILIDAFGVTTGSRGQSIIGGPGIRSRGGDLPNQGVDFERARADIIKWLQDLEDLDIPGLGGLEDTFLAALERNGGQLDKALAAVTSGLSGIFRDILAGLGMTSEDIAGSLRLLGQLTGEFGLEGNEVLQDVLDFLAGVDPDEIGQGFLDWISSISDIDIDTAEGAREFRELLLGMLSQIMSGTAPEGLFDLVSPDDVQDFISSLLGLIPGGGGNFLADALDALGIFTNLLGGEGVAAFQFFIDELLKGADAFGPGLSDLLKEAKGIDVTTQEGQDRLDALIARVGASLLAGTAMADFGVSNEILEEIALDMKRLGEGAFMGGFSSSVSVARTITEIQGNEVIIILNEIRHWTQTTAQALLATSSAQIQARAADMPVIPAATINALRNLQVLTGGSAGESTAARIMNMTNNFQIEINASPSIDSIMVELDKKVRERLYQAFPRR